MINSYLLGAILVELFNLFKVKLGPASLLQLSLLPYQLSSHSTLLTVPRTSDFNLILILSPGKALYEPSANFSLVSSV